MLAFLNISLHGLASAGCSGYGAGGELDSLNQVSEAKAIECAEQNKDVIVGVKVRLSADCANNGKNELEAFHRAQRAAKHLPLMTHHTFSSVGLDICPGKMKKGDIYTHAFHGFPSSIAENSRHGLALLNSVLAAKKKGVVFDVGHGAGSFSWTVAELCAKTGFWPDCISTDLHKESCEAPCYDLTIAMSKMLHLGMPLMEVVRAVTATPAKVIGWEGKIGHLAVGAVADITVLRRSESPLWLEDSQGQMRLVKSILSPEAVWREGKSFAIVPLRLFPDPSYQSRVPLSRWEQLVVRDPQRTVPTLLLAPSREPEPSRFSTPSQQKKPQPQPQPEPRTVIGSTHEERFAALNLQLPPPPKPFGVYRPTIEQTMHDGTILLYISGHGPLLRDGTFMKGKVSQSNKAFAHSAAKQTCLAVLSTLRARLGSLNKVKRVVKVLAMVNAVPEFEDHIEVANGFSDLLRVVFGDDGVGVRSAIGVGSLPMNIPVEMELMVELHQQGPDWLADPALLPVVNACGHFTSLGGSQLHPAALAAMAAISQSFVDLNSLLLHAGKRIAELCKLPKDCGAHVTTGAAAALSLATAACLCRDQKQAGAVLPDTSGLHRKEVVLDGGSDLRWSQSIQLTGAEIVIVGKPKQPMTAEQLAQSLSANRTAAVIYFLGGGSQLTLESTIQIAHSNHVPVIVDAAAQLPPVSNLSHFVNLGADAVVFSGGKAIRGPQDSGILLGRQWLVDLARSLACPNETSVARPMKTSKEAIAGLVAALEVFVSAPSTAYPEQVNTVAQVLATRLRAQSERERVQDHLTVKVLTGLDAGVTDVQPNAHYLVLVDIKDLAFESPGKKVDSGYGDGVNHGSPLVIVPTSAPTWLANRLATLPDQNNHSLRRIAVNTTGTGLMLNPILLTEAEAEYVAERIATEVGVLKRMQHKTARL